VLDGRGEGEEVQRLHVMIQNTASDKYDKIYVVTKGNMSECIVNWVKSCVKERKRLDD